MPESILIDITTVVLLGIGAQWLGWRLRLPSILLLLVGGFLAGPVLGLLDPETLQHDWVYAFASLSVGILLFESGLNLRFAELRGTDAAVRNLLTVGVVITWALTATAAYYIVGLSLPLALLVGVILVLTGPAVVTPLLRDARPQGRVGSVARWEGAVVDPMGAILAVLVLQTITLLHAPATGPTAAGLAVSPVIEGLFLEIFVSLGVSVAATALLVFLFHRRLVPPALRDAVTLTILVAAFVVAETLQQHAGLLTATLTGLALANQPYVPMQRAMPFKESFHALLVGTLFILLSARLELDVLQYIDLNTLLFLGILVLVVRPLAVFASNLGTNLSWEEQAFLAGLAPRGVVAAAVAALFGLTLAPAFPQEAEALAPVVFAVVVGTVAVYGLTTGPLARWLDLTDPDPQGVLFVGAADWVRQIARAVQALGVPVRLIDANPYRVDQARREELPAEHVNPLAPSAPYDIDLRGVGRLLIMLPSREAGALVARHFSERFDTADIFPLPAYSADASPDAPNHVHGSLLFDTRISYASLEAYFEQGYEVSVFELTEETGYEQVRDYYDGAILPLFAYRDGTLHVRSEQDWPSRPSAPQRLVALVDPEQASPNAEAPAVAPLSATSLRTVDAET